MTSLLVGKIIELWVFKFLTWFCLSLYISWQKWLWTQLELLIACFISYENWCKEEHVHLRSTYLTCTMIPPPQPIHIVMEKNNKISTNLKSQKPKDFVKQEIMFIIFPNSKILKRMKSPKGTIINILKDECHILFKKQVHGIYGDCDINHIAHIVVSMTTCNM